MARYDRFTKGIRMSSGSLSVMTIRKTGPTVMDKCDIEVPGACKFTETGPFQTCLIVEDNQLLTYARPASSSLSCPVSGWRQREPPNLVLQRTRPAATVSGNIEASLGGPVR